MNVNKIKFFGMNFVLQDKVLIDPKLFQIKAVTKKK